jgi:geranylgeranyl diphosphate synthase type II
MDLKKYQDKVNFLIYGYIDTIKDEKLQEMVNYSLDGGKRLRSVICMYLLDNFNIENNELIVAIEILHCSSLILDDLPCMDNDDYRRDKLTFHKKYGTKYAYKVSSFLFNEFNRIILELNNTNIINYVFDNLMLIVKGQYYDLGFESKILSINDSIYNNNLKTYPFFVIAFMVPFYLSNINIDCFRDDIDKLALNFSTAFQIYDDFIDYENDLKTQNFNHIKLIGNIKTYDLYTKSINTFVNLCKKHNIYGKLMIDIINYLNNNLCNYINDFQ